MDSVINRLRNTVSTVTSTVSQLSVVLPGNPVTREFEINQHLASAGPGLLWKIYSGYKKSTKQEASIFVFEKRQLDKYGKREREQLIETLKKGVQQLTKLRHPRVLTVQHPLEESRDSLAFAAEPIFSSLANVLGQTENMPLENISLKNYKLHEVEIKYGLLQIADALTFLHRDAKIVHGNLCPESIVINEQGSWKIFGLDFSTQATVNGSEVKWSCREYEESSNLVSLPNLCYLAPEYGKTLSPASDMFSLGSLTYTVFNQGAPLFLSHTFHSYQNNTKLLKTLTESKLVAIPLEIKIFVKTLLSFIPENRPDSHQFSKVEYFLHDSGVKTLTYLDSLFQWDNLQKSKFYKGLTEFLPKLPHRVRVHRIVPCLAQEFVNPTMVPFVLPNVLKIAECSSNEEFATHILPYLKEVMKLREPVQILFIFMKYMELLLQKTPPDITKSDVLPLIYGSLESDSTQVQELCLAIIPSFAALIDYPAMKSSLLPRIRKLCFATPSLSVRVNCLVCIGKILDHLDKWLVVEFILPFLSELSSREPAVIMGIVGIVQLCSSSPKLGVTKEVISSRLIPLLFPLLIETRLSLPQFNTLLSLIKQLFKRVEVEQREKLETLSNLKSEDMSNSFEYNSPPNGGDKSEENKNSAEINDIFGDLVLAPTSPQIQPVQPSHFPNTPSPPQIVSKNHKSIDLTSTLINTQLSQLSHSQNLNSLENSTQNWGVSQIRPSPSLNLSQFRPIEPRLPMSQTTHFQPGLTGVNFNAQSIGNGNSVRKPGPQGNITLSHKDIEDFLK